MNPARKMVLTLLGASLLLCVMAATASAKEVITVSKANGGNYNITAYNTVTRSYYFINGSLDSDSHQITVPNGYACTITVTLDRAVGDRNLYEKQDPLHPKFEVRKKSTFLLELVRTGSGFNLPSSNSVLPNFLGGGDNGQRQPPPGQ